METHLTWTGLVRLFQKHHDFHMSYIYTINRSCIKLNSFVRLMSSWRHAIKMTDRIKLLCTNTASYPSIFNSVCLWYRTATLTELFDRCTASMRDPKLTFWSENDRPLLCTWHPWMACTFHHTYQADSPLILIQLVGWWWTEPVGLKNKLPLAFICTTAVYKLHIYVASNETMYCKLGRVGQILVVIYSHLSVMTYVKDSRVICGIQSGHPTNYSVTAANHQFQI